MQTWFVHLGKPICWVLSASIPGNLSFRLPDHVWVQSGLIVLLEVIHESKCLFLEVWQHKVWLAVLDEGLFTDVKESYSGHIL